MPVMRTAGVAIVLLACILFAGRAAAAEMCSKEARRRMLAVGIAERKIAALCPSAPRGRGLVTMSLREAADELGYCRVTLALRNDSIHYLNSLALTTVGARFDIFHFSNILPGATGYASAKSRSLLECGELSEVKVVFLWPGTVRVDDRPIGGRRLEQFKPNLASAELAWDR